MKDVLKELRVKRTHVATVSIMVFLSFVSTLFWSEGILRETFQWETERQMQSRMGKSVGEEASRNLHHNHQLRKANMEGSEVASERRMYMR